MVDLNFNYEEQEAARKAAKADPRNENLLIIPTLSEKVLKRIKTLQLKTEAKGISAEEKGNRVQALDDMLQNLKLSGQNLGALLSEAIKNNKEPVTSLIVSGHHGGERFTGDMGRLEESDIAKAFKANPEQAKNLQSLYLWGCYTGTKKQVKNFKELKDTGVLPNLQVMAGFLLKAPRQDKEVDKTYLTKMMINEHKASSISGIRSVIKTITGIHDTYFAITSFCGQGAYVTADPDDISQTKEYKNLDRILECNQAEIKKYLDGPYQEFKKYLLAEEKGYTDIPPGAAEMKSGVLRKIYNQGREIQHCFDVTSEYYRGIDQMMLPLMYMEKVVNHFVTAFAPETIKIKEILKKMGKSDLFPDLKLKPRKALLAKIKALSDFVEKVSSDAQVRLNEEIKKAKLEKRELPLGDTLTPEERLLSDYSSDLSGIITNANPADAIDWIENTSSDSKLRQGSRIEKTKEQSGKKAPVLSLGGGENNKDNKDDKGQPPKKDDSTSAGATESKMEIGTKSN
jgi:hypothetical protein